MKRKLLTLVLALAMVMTLLPTSALAAGPLATALDFTSATGDDGSLENDGYFWDYDEQTLTLDGLNMQVPGKTSSGAHFGIRLPDDAVIVLAEGSENTITMGESRYSNYGIQGQGSLTIQGDGTLAVNAGDAGTTSYGISASSLSVEGGTLTVTAGGSTGRQGTSIAICATDGDIDISGGTVTARGGDVTGNGAQSYGIAINAANPDDGGDITITGKHTVVEAFGGEATGSPVTGSGGIMIATGDGGVLVDGAEVTAVGGDATRSWGISGRFAYSYDTGISGESCGVILQNATVTAEGGDVSVAENFSYGILSDGDILIEDSTVDATGGTVTVDKSRYDECLEYGWSVSFGIAIEVYEGDITILNSAVTAAGGDSDVDSCGIYTTDNLYVEDAKSFFASSGTAGNSSRGIAADFGEVTVEGSDGFSAISGEGKAISYGITASSLTVTDSAGFTAESAGGDGWSMGIYVWGGGTVLTVDDGSDLTARAGQSPNSYGIYASGDVDVNDGPVEAAGYTRGAYWNSIDMDGYLNHIVYVHETNVNGRDKRYVEDGQITEESNLEKYRYVLITAGTVGVTITPADILIYMGGDDGYDGATDGEQTGSTSMPRPLFYAELTGGWDGLEADLVEDVVLQGSGEREWRFVDVGEDAAGKDLYYIDSTGFEGQDPVRVQFTDEAGNTYVSDAFTPSGDNLATTYTISLYRGGATGVSATIAGRTDCEVAVDGTGTLTVRYVVDSEEGNNPVTHVQTEEVTEIVSSGTAAAAVPEGTAYTLNDTSVEVEPQGVGLLFDQIYTQGEDDTLEAVAQRVDEELGEAAGERQYEARYLDLVDADNGNAVVRADKAVTVTWGYPEGTDQDTVFSLLHFQGFDRGETDVTGETITSWKKVAEVQTENTEYGIRFTVDSFSPFALVWETPRDEETPDHPGLTVTKELISVNGEDYTGGSVAAGDVLTYEVTVKNTGDVALSNVTVTDAMKNAAGSISVDQDALPQDVEYDAKTGRFTLHLTLRETDTFTYTYAVREEDAGQTLRNTVTAEAARYHVSDSDSQSVYVEEEEEPPFTLPDTVFRPTLNYQDHVAYIIGYTDGTVRPLNEITRSEVAAIFFRLLTDESRAYYWSQTNSYTDVDAGDWFNNAVSTLSNAGILTGYEDGTYRPDQPITRAEFAAIAARFSDAAYTGGSTFTDVSAAYWAARYIALAQAEGWITGYEDGTYRPDQNITRAEVMTLINRVLERAVNENGLRYDMATWRDNVPGTWYYEAVQEATNSHQYTRTFLPVPGQDFNYEYWHSILPAPDWAALEKAWSTAYSK